MRALMFVLVLAFGCSFDLDHDLDITVGIDDSCLTCLPVCDATGYYCHDAEGRDCEGCNVGCLAGRVLMCAPDGPHCTQEFVGDEETVPTFCLARDAE